MPTFTKAVHALGNGKIIAFCQGADLINFYGPPYSSPNILTVKTICPENFKDEIYRESGAAIQHHRIGFANTEILKFTEFVDSSHPVYFRNFNHKENTKDSAPISFHIKPAAPETIQKLIKVKLGEKECYLLITYPGGKIFHYPTVLTSFHWIIPFGNCEIKENKGLIFVPRAGKSSLAIVGHNDFSVGLPIAEKIAETNPTDSFNCTKNYWNKFTKNRETLTENFDLLPPKYKKIIDGVATLIKIQQSDDGGEMAGHYYPLAYARDQYGVAKGMLALGMFAEAKSALNFRFNKFIHFGNLRNAESMGTHCARHIHENDDVEQTGYIILQARDYYNKTGDKKFINKIFPMLNWCWNAQKKHLAGGSLPFNGDETYVAGGFFPRSGLLHGSADSTLVFIESGKWLAEWAMKNKLWEKAFAENQLKSIDETIKSWRALFFYKNKILANAPERINFISPPRFRHGVCENLCSWFGWTQRAKSGRYQCPLCFGKKILPANSPTKTEIFSVALLPTFIESDILNVNELADVVNHILEMEKSNGHIPTVPNGAGCVGYDAGFLLLALKKLNHPATQRVENRLINMLDERGAWNEYYDENDKFKETSCRYRPWESAINAFALIQ